VVAHPTILPFLSKLSVMNFPNLDELLFLRVLALPKASRIGFADKIFCSIPEAEPAASEKYERQSFVVSV
jgi:hypothetical protein